jgi:hypothetical protein
VWHMRVAAPALEARRCRSRRWRRSVWLEEQSDGRASGEEKMDWTSSRGCGRDKDRAVRHMQGDKEPRAVGNRQRNGNRGSSCPSSARSEGTGVV